MKNRTHSKEQLHATNTDVARIFLRSALKWKWLGVIIFLSVTGTTIIGTIAPFYLKRIVDLLANSTPNISIYNSALHALWLYLGLEIASWILWRICAVTTNRFQPNVMRDLQETAFAHILGHSYQFFSDRFAGSLVRKVGRLSRAFERIIDSITFNVIPIVFTLIGIFIGLHFRFPLIAFIFALWTAVFLALNYATAQWKMPLDIKRAELDTESTGVLADAITNSITIKLFTGFSFEIKRYREVLERWSQIMTKGWDRNEIAMALQTVLMVALDVGLMAVGILFWSRGKITVGDLFLIQSYLALALGKLWDVSRLFRNIFEGLADAKEMAEIINLPYGVVDISGATKLRVKQGAIEFRKVSFQYHDRLVLSDFSLSIKPGEKIAFVGPSGAGKTTITKLLLRFYDLTSGAILIDGKNISQVSQNSLREALSLVPQEPILFHRTLRENIQYGCREANDREIIEAAKKAHCHEFIREFSEGYDTYVGERGVKLSGGERQRIAIARAILKNAPILILDEATSSLDSESEYLIQDALSTLMKAKTTLVIAHRLSTIMKMDRIVVMRQGRIEAIGTHDELKDSRGLYRKLWNIQAGGFKKA